MKNKIQYKNYFQEYFKLLSNKKNIEKLNKIETEIKKVKKNKSKIILIGNGGSAATAGHLLVDFTKQAQIKAVNFKEISLITAFANDYGFENYISKALEFYAYKKDLVIFISVSGNSKNLVNGIKYCRKNLAGFKIPKKVFFEQLPRTSTGKIQKFNLRKFLRNQ